MPRSSPNEFTAHLLCSEAFKETDRAARANRRPDRSQNRFTIRRVNSEKQLPLDDPLLPGKLHTACCGRREDTGQHKHVTRLHYHTANETSDTPSLPSFSFLASSDARCDVDDAETRSQVVGGLQTTDGTAESDTYEVAEHLLAEGLSLAVLWNSPRAVSCIHFHSPSSLYLRRSTSRVFRRLCPRCTIEVVLGRVLTTILASWVALP